MRMKTQPSKDYHDSYSYHFPNRIALRAGKKGARPAEFGTLTAVFEKLATELRLKQKLQKSKSTIQIAAFNIRTLSRIGQQPELIASAIDHKIDIIWILEHRYLHSEDIKYYDTDNGWTFVSASVWKNAVNAGIEGILIGSRALKSQNNIEKIQLRMMVATFNGNPSSTIISCYSPTNVSEGTGLIAFYNQLSSLVRSIQKHDVLVIDENMNTQTSQNVNNKFSLHNSSNRNGEHLTDFTLENRLRCLNIKFQKRKGKR